MENSKWFPELHGNFGLNKIAARWPAKAVAQFYFIDIKKQWKYSS